MNPEDTVRTALQALADHDRDRESSLPAPRMRAPRPVSRWKTGTAYAAVALAAAATVLVLVRPSSESALAPAAAPVMEAAPTVTEMTPAPKPAPVRQGRRRAAVLASTQVEPDNEIVTEFFPLMDADLPFQHGQLLRVMVPAETMQRVGLPVRPERWSDRVTADVLVGDEGMPRAIRFVSFQQ